MAMIMGKASAVDVLALSHVSLEVADLERSIAFYREWLGLTIFRDDRDDPRQPNIKGLVAGLGFELAQAPARSPSAGRRPAGTPPGAPCLSFAVRDAEAAFAALKAKGLVEAEAPTQMGGAKFFSFFDPDGQAVELIEFPAPLQVLADLSGLGEAG